MLNKCLRLTRKLLSATQLCVNGLDAKWCDYSQCNVNVVNVVNGVTELITNESAL